MSNRAASNSRHGRAVRDHLAWVRDQDPVESDPIIYGRAAQWLADEVERARGEERRLRAENERQRELLSAIAKAAGYSGPTDGLVARVRRWALNEWRERSERTPTGGE